MAKYNPKDPQSFIMKYNDGTLLEEVYQKIASLTDFFYPVGTIYETENTDFDPNKVWGGTWVKIEGKILAGYDSDDTYFDAIGYGANSAGVTGEKTHTLQEREMPRHNHPLYSGSHTFSWGETVTSEVYLKNASATAGTPSNNEAMTSQGYWNKTNYTGSSYPHNNMPPYEVVVIWKRTE